MNGASVNGHIKILQWWKDSGLPLLYSACAQTKAQANGHIDIYLWWKDSGLLD